MQAGKTHSRSLEREARALMTPGVTSIPDDASLNQVVRVLREHRIHAVLVVGAESGKPLGWITAKGLMPWLERDLSFSFARDAIAEPVITVEPSEPIGEVIATLAHSSAGRVLVQRHPDSFPEGVISVLDLLDLIRHEGPQWP
jgi:CBS domain-containing protein